MPTCTTPWDRAVAAHPAPASPRATPNPQMPEVCVVGAGIAGLTTAYCLARAGRSVAVYDANEVGAGQTALSTAHLVSALDDRFVELERLHGRVGARLAAESHAAAIDFIDELVTLRKIPCHFRRLDGYLVSADGDEPALVKECAAAVRAGLTAEMVNQIPGLTAATGPAVRFAGQARINPLVYLHGLLDACQALGVRVHTGQRIARVTDGEVAEIETEDGFVVQCQAVVVATHVPINDRVLLQTKLEAYRTYVITMRLDTCTFPDALLWDDGDPYHYLRITEDEGGPLLVIGGEDHLTGQGTPDPDLPYNQLETWARDRFPGLGEVVDYWSGQIIEPVDALAYIGHNPGATNVYVITGDSGNGLTHGTLGGMILADAICGLANPWAELYRPSRITLAAAGEYTRHNAQVLRQYADWLSPGDLDNCQQIESGMGGIVRNGLHPIAASRTEDGRLHLCSAICPHLGGLVRWNQTEQTWDCPCHGSRFSPTGQVLNGPANIGLAPAEEPLDPVAPAGLLA